MTVADKHEHLGVVFTMQEWERSFQVFSDKHQNQVQNLPLDREAAIDRMVRDVVRVQCSKVLVSPEVWDACADRINSWERQVDVARLVHTGNVYVRGVPVERCESLTGTEYALVPERR